MKFYATCLYILAALISSAGDYFNAERVNSPLGEEPPKLPTMDSELREQFRLRQRIILGALRHDQAERSRPAISRELEGDLVSLRL